MNNANIPPVEFCDATIQVEVQQGGWSWSAQLPSVPATYTDGRLYLTASDAQTAAKRYLTRSAAEWAMLRTIGDIYERRDGTLPYSEYSALCDSITLSDLG